jgi:murein DD-endopeptidase MepM/ murein hydrolase activator NlpD
LLKAPVDVQRVLERLRRPARSTPSTTTKLLQRRRVAARHVRLGVDTAASSARFLPRGTQRRSLTFRPTLPTFAVLGRLGHERTVGIAVAGILLGASLISVGPAGASGDTGGTTGDGAASRLAIGGSDAIDSGIGDVETAYVDVSIDDLDAEGYLPAAQEMQAGQLAQAPGAADLTSAVAEPTTVEGPFLADGTLLKPVAVDTSVADGSDLVTTYKVKSGDTLSGIAKAHGITMMTLWWANKLKDKDALHRGQILRIPPVSGLVVKVKAGDTLPELAKEYKVTEAKILKTNEITDPNLVVGQVLIVPGAKGAPIATPKPAKKSTASHGSTRSGGSSRPPKTYSGGNFRWPTTSHHISQYYHYGHYGIDIDGSTGDPIWAAASGTVTFAGWKNNGGGYQVWIAHGSGLYTTYNHMSSVSVGRGQHVGRGQRVGRMGATGYATGSHLHFEVWKGPIWSGGRRVNPLGYL